MGGRLTVATALAATLSIAAAAAAAGPLYLDDFVEAPLERIRSVFPDLQKEGCYRVSETAYLLLTIDEEDEKPWRVVLGSSAPCTEVEEVPPVDVRHRSGVRLGDSTRQVVERLGRPEMSDAPQPPHRGLGDTEYFYLCRVEEMCARHTSIFLRDGKVVAIAEWYSE